MTAIRLADDLDVIGHLDWTPGCVVDDCDAAATVYLIVKHVCCGRTEDFLTCRPCAEGEKRRLSSLGVILCLLCGDRQLAASIPIRIVPLGGSNG